MTLAGPCSSTAFSLFPQLCRHPATQTLALMEAPVMPTTTPTHASALVDSTAGTARKVTCTRDREGSGVRDGAGCALERSWGRGGPWWGGAGRAPALSPPSAPRRAPSPQAHSCLCAISLISSSLRYFAPSRAACASPSLTVNFFVTFVTALRHWSACLKRLHFSLSIFPNRF